MVCVGLTLSSNLMEHCFHPQLWLNLAERSTTAVDWSAILHSTFNEFSTPEDDSLGAQIVKVCITDGLV